MYLDGGIEPCRRFLERHVWPRLRPEDLRNSEDVPIDPKSALQELAQALKLPTPRYYTIREAGPGHARTFTVEARAGKEFCAHAEGHSKKEAGQKAAALVIERLLAVGKTGKEA